MGAVLCMKLLTLSGCDRVVQSAVVEEKDQTEQKKGEKKETVHLAFELAALAALWLALSFDSAALLAEAVALRWASWA